MINNKNNAFRNSISEISWLNTMINEIYIYIKMYRMIKKYININLSIIFQWIFHSVFK